MKSFSTVLSESRELQNGNAGSPVGQKETTDIDLDSRVPDKKLEMVYRNVPVVHNSINKTTQVIMGRDRELRGSNVNFFRRFLDNVGDVGGSEHWNSILEKIFRYQFIYGEAYVELVRDADTGRVVDLATIDPKSVEYAKSNRIDNHIALDEYGNPLGYVQKLPSQVGSIEQVYEPPEEVTLGPNEVYFPRENIAHFKLHTFGEGFYPIGAIEPIYRDAERIHQLKEDYADKVHSTLFPYVVANVGDDTHEATPETVANVRDLLVDAKHDTVISLPDHIDLNMLEADSPESLIEHMNNFNNEIVAGMGIPKPFGTGKGDTVNRATLQAQDKMYQTSIVDIIDRTVETIRTQVFERVAESEGVDDVPQYDWDTEIRLVSAIPS